MTVVEREMVRCGLAVMGIAEHWWLGQGRFSTVEGSTIMHSGKETGRRSAGVAFMVNSETSRAVLGYNPVSERVLTLKPGVHTNDFVTIHGRPARIHTAPAEWTVDSTYCLPQALCEYARGDRESLRNR